MSLTGSVISVGYEGRTLDDLIAVLIQNAVDVLVDVRLTPLSRKKGFSKTALSSALAEVGIDYRHERNLGNPKENRIAFRDGEAAARSRYLEHMHSKAGDSLEATAWLAASSNVAILCFELDHETCHRSCVTDELRRRRPDIRVVTV